MNNRSVSCLFWVTTLVLLIVTTSHAQLRITRVCEGESQSSTGNNQLTFVNSIAGPDIDFAASLIQTSDGDYLLGNWGKRFSQEQ